MFEGPPSAKGWTTAAASALVELTHTTTTTTSLNVLVAWAVKTNGEVGTDKLRDCSCASNAQLRNPLPSAPGAWPTMQHRNTRQK